jgi:hypothetical protein
MTTIFLSSAEEDAVCADQIRQGFEQAGYTTWCEPGFPTPHDTSYPYLIENAILGSAAMVVLWSQSAASSSWVKRHLLIAQRFFKLLVPVRLDDTALPSTLLVESLVGKGSCRDIVAHVLPRLPAPGCTDPLLALGEQAAHQYIRVRKEAIDQAAAILQQGEHREEVLVILDYLARNDLISSVRQKAQEVLKAAAPPKSVSSPVLMPQQEARHLFGVRCQNGHITTFDRREVCSERKEVMRGLDELILSCPTCSSKMAVDVDCEGY